MRRVIVLLVVAVAFVAAVALPAGAGEPDEIVVDAGQSVEVAHDVIVTVEPNGDVSVIDGVFFYKVSSGGQPTSITIGNDNLVMIVIPGGYCDSKFC